MKTLKTAIALTAALTFIAAPSLADTVQTTLTFDVTDFDFSEITVGDDTYDLVTYDGALRYDVPGKPALPVIPYSLSIPFGSTVTDVEITGSVSEVIDGMYYLYPGQDPIRMDGYQYCWAPDWDAPWEFTDPSAVIYESTDPFPADADLLEDNGYGESRGHLLAEFSVFPMQYVAYEGKLQKLKLYTSITVRVTYTPPQGQPEADRHEWPELHNRWADWIKATVRNSGDVYDNREPIIEADVMEWGTETENSEEIPWVKPADSAFYEYNLPQEVEGFIGATEPAYPFPFIVITNDEWVTAEGTTSQPGLLDALDNFYEWKMRKGVPLHIVMVDDIIENSEGDDNQDKIRNWMKDISDVYGTQAFLFVGDTARPTVGYTSETWETYGDYGVVPSRYVTSSVGGYLHVSDYYFTCLDGSWGPYIHNDIGYYGVTEAVTKESLEPTVIVGRLPVGDAGGGTKAEEETVNYVAKLIKYEKEPVAGYVDEALLIGTDFGPDECDRVSEYLGSFSLTKVYEDDGSQYPTYPEPHDVLDAMNDGAGITVFATHGHPLCHYLLTHAGNPGVYIQEFTVTKDMPVGYGNYMIFATGQKEVDNDGKYGLLFALACSTSKYDYRDAEGEECLCEEYLADGDGGGVAYLGNSHVGYKGSSCTLATYFFDHLLNNEGYKAIGQPTAFARGKFCGGSPSHVAYTLNLGGDPTMEVWTDEPAPLYIDYDWWENGGMMTLEVTVTTTGNQTVPGAKVCLWQTNYYLTATTGDGGKCRFKELSAFNDGKLTATKHNYKPALEDDVVVGM
jgi:hypothetical protein